MVQRAWGKGFTGAAVGFFGSSTATRLRSICAMPSRSQSKRNLSDREKMQHRLGRLAVAVFELRAHIREHRIVFRASYTFVHAQPLVFLRDVAVGRCVTRCRDSR